MAMDHVGTFVALFLCALTSAANGATYYYKPANLSEDSLVNTRTILDVSRSLCAALCSASSCDSYRCGSDSEQRLCQLGNYEHDAGTIYLAGGFTTFLGLKSSVDACFGMMPRAANHYQVEEICGRLSGSFPEPRTQGQVDRLADIVGQFGKRIGFKEDGSMPGVYRWESDGTVVPWVVNGAHAQGCGRLQPDGRFHRMQCGGSGMPFSCQFC